jgi:lysozyme
VSDTADKRKVSREGVILIKSFEGFRAVAQPRPEGGWVIGYGHTRSAREGLTVSEPDAELLLQYDLLPVVASLNAKAPGWLNQHQFDALASYVFSIGVDGFDRSEVLSRLRAGSPDEAADAMVGWPETTPADAVIRRRAAERALFVADADAPVTLSQLMAAPLPPPPFQPAPVEAAPVDEVVEAPVDEPTPPAAPVVEEAPVAEDATAESVEEPVDVAEPVEATAPVEADVDVAGEADGVEATPETDAALSPEPEPVVEPTFEAPAVEAEAVETVEPAPDVPAETVEPVDATKDAPAVEPDASEPVEPEPEAPAEAIEADEAPVEAEAPAEPEAPAAAQPAEAETPAFAMPQVARSLRYSPYANVVVGPLTGIGGGMTVVAPAAKAQPPAPVTEPQAVPAAPVEEVLAEPIAEALPTEADYSHSVVEAAPGLVLTPPEDRDPPILRPAWSDEQRGLSLEDQSPLFEEPLQIAPGAVLRHEVVATPRRNDWSETGAFVAMGGIGLVSFGAAMAAFRRAQDQASGGDQVAMVGWVLALIALICVGVSGYNLFRTWTADRKAD